MKQKRLPLSDTTPVVRIAAVSTAQPGHIIPSSWFRKLTDFDLWLVCSGKVEAHDEKGQAVILQRGSVVCLAPGDVFELHVKPPAPYTNIFVHFDLIDANGRRLNRKEVLLPPVIGTIPDIAYFESTLRRMMFLLYHYRNSDTGISTHVQKELSCLLKGLLFDYHLSSRELAGASGVQKAHQQMVSSALSRIYHHPGSVLSAAELAREFGHSQRHFCRLFRLITGKPPGRTLIEARIDHAKKLLATSAMTITEISESLKYENIFYFSRQFKKVTGLSPKDFRKGSPGLPRPQTKDPDLKKRPPKGAYSSSARGTM